MKKVLVAYCPHCMEILCRGTYKKCITAAAHHIDSYGHNVIVGVSCDGTDTLEDMLHNNQNLEE